MIVEVTQGVIKIGLSVKLTKDNQFFVDFCLKIDKNEKSKINP
ncbi:hypothetical protein [Metabacillus bambusae]|nr:hypothetical protein [Metabacillus bambusae]